ncbi:MAG: sulfatase [Oscillospiraceae bacterium]|nr:sulfatase [Oscillospiraceae bacterium]
MEKNEKRPNILFAIADDASHFGAYGHEFVNTPNIDKIAKEGVLFENAFTPSPKCAPSRACILTGRYPWQNEEACNHFCFFPNKFALLPDLLEQAGYFAGYTGKGWAPGDYLASGLKRNPAGDEFNKFWLQPPENTCVSRTDYAANFADFMSCKPPEKPFYFWYGAWEPHRPYKFGEGLRAGKSTSEIAKLPAYFPDCEKVRTDMIDYAYEIEWFDAQLGKMLRQLEEAGELENTIVIATSDNGCSFPRVKGQMYEQDFHLPMAGMWKAAKKRQGRKITDIINFVDIAPTFLAAAGVAKHPQMSGNSFLDVFLSDSSGQIDNSRNAAYFGREQQDLGSENDLGYPVRCMRNSQYLYIHNRAPDRWPAGNPETGFTNCDSSPTKDEILALKEKGEAFYYELAFGKRPGEELYDIEKDPECLANIAEIHSETVLKSMRAQLNEFLVKTEDPGLLVSPGYFDEMKLKSEEDAPYSWKSYMQGTWQKQTY